MARLVRWKYDDVGKDHCQIFKFQVPVSEHVSKGQQFAPYWSIPCFTSSDVVQSSQSGMAALAADDGSVLSRCIILW